MATIYTPAKVQEYLDAVAELYSKNLDREEGDRLTLAEEALYAEGWRNNESKEELEAIAKQAN